jgi:RecA/RadA recombinase
MATKPFDLTKFRKTLTKSIDGLGVGFNDPTDWVSTGNYALNYLISSDFNKGIPLGKVTVFAGESGAGKSYICSGNIIKHAQEQNIYVVLIDSENALDEAWLHALGVDTSEEKLLKLNMAMIDDVAKTISEFMKEYKAMEDKPKVLFVVDSLGMLLTPTDINQFEAGDLKGDMGRKPKALTALVRNCVNMFGSHNVGLVCTNHSYASQDMFDPDDKISGGQGFIYASSIIVAMKKLKLKEDEDGNKVSEVNGIRASCKIMKTRYAKPFESLQIKIPYTTGMNPFSGLVDLFEKKRILSKDGNRLKYVATDGTEIKMYRKEWESNTNDSLLRAMNEFTDEPVLLDAVDDADDIDDYVMENEDVE